MKLVVDCSKPGDHPEHAVLRSLSAAEKKQQAKDAKAGPRIRPPSAGQIAAGLVEQAETLDEVKQVLADFLRGR